MNKRKIINIFDKYFGIKNPFYQSKIFQQMVFDSSTEEEVFTKLRNK